MNEDVYLRSVGSKYRYVPTTDNWFPSWNIGGLFVLVFIEVNQHPTDEGLQYRVGACGMDDTLLVKDFFTGELDAAIALYKELTSSKDLSIQQAEGLGMKQE